MMSSHSVDYVCIAALAAEPSDPVESKIYLERLVATTLDVVKNCDENEKMQRQMKRSAASVEIPSENEPPMKMLKTFEGCRSSIGSEVTFDAPSFNESPKKTIKTFERRRHPISSAVPVQVPATVQPPKQMIQTSECRRRPILSEVPGPSNCHGISTAIKKSPTMASVISEDMLSSKRTVPLKIVPKAKLVIKPIDSLVSKDSCRPTAAKVSLAEKKREEERLQRQQEERHSRIQEKNKIAAEKVADVKALLAKSREERRQKAQLEKINGGPIEQPKEVQKKQKQRGRFSYRH
uniref:TPX2 domain-containing protein n=2 Tax=Caenorhabditis tropicalis TaxID=1561998 RepID=A0A1I7TER1_9PELO